MCCILRLVRCSVRFISCLSTEAGWTGNTSVDWNGSSLPQTECVERLGVELVIVIHPAVSLHFGQELMQQIGWQQKHLGDFRLLFLIPEPFSSAESQLCKDGIKCGGRRATDGIQTVRPVDQVPLKPKKLGGKN